MTLILPPIRELIRPDPGFILIDADLERADAQIVAGESREPELLKVFQLGTDIHTENAAWIYRKDPPLAAQRQRAKNGIHLTDYAGKARTLAATLETTVTRAEEFQRWWFGRFPGILKWHKKVENDLKFKHYVMNVWGQRRFYFDIRGGGDLGMIIPQATAWLGQSGVAGVINRAMLRIYRELRGDVQLLNQVHDSLLMQVPEKLCPAIFPVILQTMRVEVPFESPFVIPASLKWSAESWGQMESWKTAKSEGVRDAA